MSDNIHGHERWDTWYVAYVGVCLLYLARHHNTKPRPQYGSKQMAIWREEYSSHCSFTERQSALTAAWEICNKTYCQVKGKMSHWHCLSWICVSRSSFVTHLFFPFSFLKVRRPDVYWPRPSLFFLCSLNCLQINVLVFFLLYILNTSSEWPSQ